MEAASVLAAVSPKSDESPKSEHKIRVIFEEAFELAFLICNTLFDDYDVSKVLYMVEQLIPTAVVLETAYWMFFFPANGEQMCVCNRFHIPCKHVRSQLHWLDLNYDRAPKEDAYVVERGMGRIGIPVNFALDILPGTSRTMEVLINLHIQNCTLNTQRVVQFQTVSPLYTIRLSYSIVPERKASKTNTIQFTPHPALHSHYGRIFPHLQNRYRCFSRYGCYTHVPTKFVIDLTIPSNKFTIQHQRTHLDIGGNDFRKLTTIINNYPVDMLKQNYQPAFKMNILTANCYNYLCPDEFYTTPQISAVNPNRPFGEALWQNYQTPLYVDTDDEDDDNDDEVQTAPTNLKDDTDESTDDDKAGAVTYASIVRRRKRKVVE